MSAKNKLYHLSPPFAFLSSMVILKPSIIALLVIKFVSNGSFKFGEKLRFTREKSRVTNFETPLIFSMVILIPTSHRLT